MKRKISGIKFEIKIGMKEVNSPKFKIISRPSVQKILWNKVK